MLILHPGGKNSPVCGECETRYIEAADPRHSTGKIEDDVSAELHLIHLDVDTCVVSTKSTKADVRYKEDHGQLNGLITSGEYKGFWAHGKCIDGRYIWFLARPNLNSSCGTTAAYPQDSMQDVRLWRAVAYNFGDKDKMNYGGYTYQVGDSVSSSTHM